MNPSAPALKLKGKTAIVTGGASGIGLACAHRLCEDGATVLIADVQAEACVLAVEALAARGGNASYLVTDVSHPQDITRLVDTAIRLHGGIDICVSSAGIVDKPVLFHHLDVADFDRIMGVNLRGPLMLGQAVAQHMLDTGRQGSITHISSVGGELAVPEVPSYCISKAGLDMLTKLMAVTLAPQGIRVNAVAPGPTRTRMQSGVETPDWVLARTPLGRVAEPEEIAAIVAFLSSEDASYLTGQTLYADGGRLALNYTMNTAKK